MWREDAWCLCLPPPRLSNLKGHCHLHANHPLLCSPTVEQKHCGSRTKAQEQRQRERGREGEREGEREECIREKERGRKRGRERERDHRWQNTKVWCKAFGMQQENVLAAAAISCSITHTHTHTHFPAALSSGLGLYYPSKPWPRKAPYVASSTTIFTLRLRGQHYYEQGSDRPSQHYYEQGSERPSQHSYEQASDRPHHLSPTLLWTCLTQATPFESNTTMNKSQTGYAIWVQYYYEQASDRPSQHYYEQASERPSQHSYEQASEATPIESNTTMNML